MATARGTVKELRAALSKKGLSTAGRKAELIARMDAATQKKKPPTKRKATPVKKSSSVKKAKTESPAQLSRQSTLYAHTRDVEDRGGVTLRPHHRTDERYTGTTKMRASKRSAKRSSSRSPTPTSTRAATPRSRSGAARRSARKRKTPTKWDPAVSATFTSADESAPASPAATPAAPLSAAAKASSASGAAPWLTGRNVVLALLVLVAAFGVKQFGALASEKIHASLVWAESVVDPTSDLHLFYFLLVSMVLHFPAPLPGAMTAWAVAIGCFFPAPRAFALLAVSFAIGVPMSFFIGRAVAKIECLKAAIASSLPSAFAYMENLRGAISNEPTKLSFLLMWAPMATSLCPFMVGFVAPSSELGFVPFILGAFPSKMLHFGMTVMLGLEAGSFAAAEDAHGNDGTAKKVAMVGAVIAMMWYVHHALDKHAHAAEAAKKK